MYDLALERLKRISSSGQRDPLQGRRIGVEKESLRMNIAKGDISQQPHPISLGAALTHPHITTDYSEALMEFVTPPHLAMEDTLGFLQDVHQFVYSKLDNELLWGSSMPCVLGDEGVPVAYYGESNAGTMKRVYREGLGHRYGKVMQVIAGIHFNYSFPDSFWALCQQLEGDARPLQTYIADRYFGMVRNLQRFGWLIPYLFGASPAICKSFLQGRESVLKEFDLHTAYLPYATSLRMGDIGYQNSVEGEVGIKANYNSLEQYVASLTEAIETPCENWAKLGVKVDGEYRQLNANRLQIENEYYSSTRPKQILQGDEKPTMALSRRGVAYIELRSLDISPFDPMGINEREMRFLEGFMLLCALQESPPINDAERKAIDANLLTVAHRGREPQLKLQRGDGQIGLREWGEELFDVMAEFCDLLDAGHADHPYCKSIAWQRQKLWDTEATPSARVLHEMRSRDECFFEFSLRKSEEHKAYFDAMPMRDEIKQRFTHLAETSLRQQQEIEASDSIDFDTYLANYFAQKA